MQDFSITEALESLDKLEATRAAYQHAVGVLYLDATTAAPPDSWEGRGRTMEVMSQVMYDLDSSPANWDLLTNLQEHCQELTPQRRREVEVLRRELDQIRRIPREEYVAYQVLLNDAEVHWRKAKQENDFSIFAPYLEKIVRFNCRIAGLYHPEMDPYDALLDLYEEGMNTKTLDEFFERLRQTIVPLLARISKKQQPEDGFLNQPYPIEMQRKFSDCLMDLLGLDRSHCTIAETEHPYTANFGNKDVRITTHYDEEHPAFSMYSVIHEAGHAFYELGADDCYNYTALSGGVSMGIHESQSLFYENIIGRSEAFIQAVFPLMQQLFPEQLGQVDAGMLYRAVNKAEPGLIRTKADELTYGLHIMVRYQIEKELIHQNLQVAEVPRRWNELYREYLGIEVPSDTEGCLQDSHWSGGSIGYFPSYALGSAYAAQLKHKLEDELGDFWPEIARGDLSRVTGWLREKIHRHASFYKPGELLEQACGKFDPQYFVDYLTEKYEKLYDL